MMDTEKMNLFTVTTNRHCTLDKTYVLSKAKLKA